jgi:hypothetical protein
MSPPPSDGNIYEIQGLGAGVFNYFNFRFLNKGFFLIIPATLRDFTPRFLHYVFNKPPNPSYFTS